MELDIKRDDFLEALYWTQSTVERRNTMPILANVLIEARNGEVWVTATDLEVGVRAKLSGESKSEGKVTLNAKKLYEIVREVSEERVQMRGLENERVEVKSGKSVFKMVGLDAQEFPGFPTFDGGNLFPLPAKVLKEMVDKTFFAVSADETRSNLNGTFMEEAEGGKVRMVATDGHRLAMIERSVGSIGLTKGVILPRKGLGELRKLIEEVEDGVVSIGFKNNMGLFVKDNVELFMRLIESDFPDYGKVIPKDNVFEAKVDQRGFQQALRRVSILSSERYKGIKMEFKPGSMAIMANNPDLGEAVEELEMEYNGQALSIGFNAKYLMEILHVLVEDSDVCIQLKDEVSPGLIRRECDQDYIYVVMPMRM